MRFEYLGVFGLSWEEKVASAMYKILGADYKDTMKKFGQAGGYNINLVKTLYNGYSLHGFKSATAEGISVSTKVELPIVKAFMLALSDLAIKGDIDYKLYDPETVKKSSIIKTDMLTPQPVKKIEQYVKIGLLLTTGFLILKGMSYLPKGAQ